jgi:hypothetical protein
LLDYRNTYADIYWYEQEKIKKSSKPVEKTAASEQINSSVKEPTEVANVLAIASVGIGAGLIIVIAFIGLATLVLSAKDEKTGETVDIGTYTAQEVANLTQFTAQVCKDIYKAVGKKLAEAQISFEKFKQDFTEKFTKIIDENLEKIPGFDLDPGLETAPDTGHTGNETSNIPTKTPPTDTTSGQVTREHLDTGHTQTHEDLEAPVMESSNRWSSSYRYQRNAAPVSYRNQVHHLITDAESQASDLTQEAHDRGLWEVDETDNLIRLPSSATAYQQAPANLQIKHRGSHPIWSQHVQDTLRTKQRDLENQYGTLDNVPDNVLEQTIDDTENILRNDLLDKNKGRQGGWIQPQPDGTDKLSTREKDEVIA